MVKDFSVKNVTETARVAADLAMELEKAGRKNAFIALYGDMGVGKTAFVSGFCRYLGIEGAHSPTYTVVNEYRKGRIPVFHFDLYRLEGEDELCSIGFDDYLARDGYALCEWSERLCDALPAGAIRVEIKKTDAENGRHIRIILPENA